MSGGVSVVDVIALRLSVFINPREGRKQSIIIIIIIIIIITIIIIVVVVIVISNLITISNLYQSYPSTVVKLGAKKLQVNNE